MGIKTGVSQPFTSLEGSKNIREFADSLVEILGYTKSHQTQHHIQFQSFSQLKVITPATGPETTRSAQFKFLILVRLHGVFPPIVRQNCHPETNMY